MSNDNSKKVLIIEDDISYRNSLSAYLSGHGLEVSVAEDGSQAMEKLLFHLPKLIILDLLLPKVKGMDVLKRIREYPDKNIADTPVIVLSNLSGTEETQEAKSLNAEAYLIKSENNFEEILKVVREKLFKGDAPPNYEIVDFSKNLS
jgi:chemotaxis family two-component system sensor histidine kinase/response regulator PixL